MARISLPDLAALAFFAAVWALYHVSLMRGWGGRRGLNRRMDDYRRIWMREMAARDQRMVDSSIMGSLQNGTAFFASTSLIALGGVATLLRSGDEVLKAFSDMSIGLSPDRDLFEMKIVGLLAILGYAFFKFAWSYRLFNYAAILMGATPPARSADEAERSHGAQMAARMNIVAGTHFTLGQRGFSFAIAWLGWFLGPWAFMATTAGIVWVMWARQFASDALAALTADVRDWTPPPS